MKLKKDRKINRKISSFFKLGKPGFSSAKTILSKSDFDRDSRFNLDEKVSEWKLGRMRSKAIQAERSYKIQPIQGLTLAKKSASDYSPKLSFLQS
jgi:hypothetical protein